jgi:hypothetical protein
VDGVVQILDFGLVGAVINPANGLEIAGFLEIHYVVLDAEFCADGFVAKNGELHDDRERIQNKQFVVDVFRIVGDFVHLYNTGKMFLYLFLKWGLCKITKKTTPDKGGGRIAVRLRLWGT